jgi:hypothetical protein
LFIDGPPLTPEQIHEAERQRDIAEAEARARRRERRLSSSRSVAMGTSFPQPYEIASTENRCAI